MPAYRVAEVAAQRSWMDILVRERSTYKGPADKSRRREERMKGDTAR